MPPLLAATPSVTGMQRADFHDHLHLRGLPACTTRPVTCTSRRAFMYDPPCIFARSPATCTTRLPTCTTRPAGNSARPQTCTTCMTRPADSAQHHHRVSPKFTGARVSPASARRQVIHAHLSSYKLTHTPPDAQHATLSIPRPLSANKYLMHWTRMPSTPVHAPR
ncbi:hypothetical protein PLICRDRAFT_57989 [Plicaturopsis crispa FD-325 SS-3]|uniref:Uncharacterized protein n=1 Tax=Plicaturopsis crispa FD-325 SS-3 TaxID=944288 RepID=A0A0C9T7P7_PLICR|nr:hypothetical protein PLICRDRAFT_57989 [Plicaturopsis crispa FD-325 SS-3]